MSSSDAIREKPFPPGELRQEAEKRLGGKKASAPGEMTRPEIIRLMHELQVHQIELEMQNEALLRTCAEKEELSDKYSDLFDFAPVGYFLWDRHGKILEINLAGAAMLNLDRAAAAKMRFGIFVALGDREAFASFLKRAFTGKDKESCEIKLANDGEAIDVLIEGVAAMDGGRHKMVCRAAVIDITARKRADELAAANQALEAEVAARKRAEQALSASLIEMQYQADASRTAAETIRHLARLPAENPNPVLRIARDGTILYANPVSGPLLANWELAPGKRLPEDWQRQLAAIIDAGKPLEHEMVCGDNIFSCLLCAVADESYVNIYGRDVTKSKQAEEGIKSAHDAVITEKNRLEAMMETLPVGVAIIDAKGGNVRSNDMFQKIWGGSLPETNNVADYAQFKAWWADTGKPVLPEEWASAQAVQKGETVVGQLMQIERFDGRRAFIMNSAAPILDSSGKIAGTLWPSLTSAN